MTLLCGLVQSRHNLKMPLKMFLGVQKARKKREEKARELERVSGVVTGKRHKKKASYQQRRRDEFRRRGGKGSAGVTSLSSGSFRDGIMFVKNP